MHSLQDISFRTVNYADELELRSYLEIFWKLPAENNEYFTKRTDSFMNEWLESAKNTESTENTFSGIALHSTKIVGLHIARKFEEWEQIGVHLAGLWVHPEYRGIGISKKMKQQAEVWAKSIGATFINTNVQRDNERMLSINKNAGYKVFRYNLRKRI